MLYRFLERRLDAIVLRALSFLFALERIEIGLAHNRFGVAARFFDVEKKIEYAFLLFTDIRFVLDECLYRVFKLTEHRVVFARHCAVDKIRHIVCPPC